MNAGFSWKRSQMAEQEFERVGGNYAPVNGLASVPRAGMSVSQPVSNVVARFKANAPARYISFGDFEMDLQEQRLLRAGQSVKIQGKVCQALLVLVETPGQLVTREQLRNRLWPREANLNYDANVNTTVNKLRQVLGDTSDSANYIQTVPRRGYSFIANVGYADAPTMVEAIGKPAAVLTHANSRWGAVSPGFLRSERARIWFTASVVTWVAAAVLFAGAIILYAHHAAHAPGVRAGGGSGAEMSTTP